MLKLLLIPLKDICLLLGGKKLVVGVVMMKFCPDCGTERYNNANFCSNCSFDFRTITIKSENEGQSRIKEEANDAKKTSAPIPTEDLSEIEDYLRFRHNTTYKEIKRTNDPGTYIILTENNQVHKMYMGGTLSVTHSKIIDMSPHEFFSLTENESSKKCYSSKKKWIILIKEITRYSCGDLL
ncbi:MAG: zinc ribbon domain-containing protein [Bacillus sp. (in: Bacteria)]|nr:zinc ribbon domain-containing protein [Bacillus sp. (in: firmicutes)]